MAIPKFTPQQKTLLENDFKIFNRSFNKIKDSAKIRFPNLNFVIRKLLEKNGMHQFVQLFASLMMKETLIQHKKIWKLVCQDAGWK